MKFHITRLIGIILLGIALYNLAMMVIPLYPHFDLEHNQMPYFLSLVGAAFFLSLEREK